MRKTPSSLAVTLLTPVLFIACSSNDDTTNDGENTDGVTQRYIDEFLDLGSDGKSFFSFFSEGRNVCSLRQQIETQKRGLPPGPVPQFHASCHSVT